MDHLAPVFPNQPDSGDRRRGQKAHLDCRQCDCTCGIVATTFTVPVDVTGAVSNCQRKYSGRSHVGLTVTGSGIRSQYSVCRIEASIDGADLTQDNPLERFGMEPLGGDAAIIRAALLKRICCHIDGAI